MMFRLPLLALLLLAALIVPTRARAEDGYDLWLRYRPVEASWQRRYSPAATELVGRADRRRWKRPGPSFAAVFPACSASHFRPPKA
jgi:hypothetical protein